MVTARIWLATGIIISYGSNLDANSHSHVAMQIIWPKKNSHCRLNGKPINGLYIVDSKIKHQLQMREGWIILIEPTSLLGQRLKNILNTQLPNLSFSGSPPETLDRASVLKLITPIFTLLKIDPQLLSLNQSAITDNRIKQLIAQLDEDFQTHIDPATLKAAKIAKQLNLSESRFLHLFSQQMTIAWRAYILWRRLLTAVQAIINNTSATNAAYLAGFSDSAHLSRTFKNTFGMTIKQAMAVLTHQHIKPID